MNHDVMQSNSMVSSAIIEDINGIETIKSLTSEENRYQNIDSEFVDYLEKSFKLSKYSILQTSLKQGTKLVLNILILWFGAQLVMSSKISIGQLITFNTLFLTLQLLWKILSTSKPNSNLRRSLITV